MGSLHQVCCWTVVQNIRWYTQTTWKNKSSLVTSNISGPSPVKEKQEEELSQKQDDSDVQPKPMELDEQESDKEDSYEAAEFEKDADELNSELCVVGRGKPL